MNDIVSVGDSIEGLVVDGSSRKALSYKGLARYHNRVCHRFLTEFNIKAYVIKPINDPRIKLDNKAFSNENNSLVCDIAVIHSLKDRYSSAVGSNISATHGANLWHFPNQTNVKITRSHPEIENAIRKSKLE
jgi:hypothetical protein